MKKTKIDIPVNRAEVALMIRKAFKLHDPLLFKSNHRQTELYLLKSLLSLDKFEKVRDYLYNKDELYDY